jgi:hypothetical protein
MIRKKSSFLTFCIAFLPGAGHMYMGFMKRGISLMSGFFLLIFLASWLEMDLFVFASVILWFYSFFDTFNLRATPDDEFYTIEDNFILFPHISKHNTEVFQGKFRLIFALALIFIGCVILWNNAIDLFEAVLPEEIRMLVRAFSHYFPQLLIGIAIIAFGIYLILGKKKELDTMDRINQLEDKEVGK